MKELTKRIGRLICLITAAVFSLPSLTTTAAAQDALPPPVYPVIHDKAWYDDPANVAPFTWTDEQGEQHVNKVWEEATNPLHIIALLSYVYTNPKIPGSNYAIPDSANMEGVYRYKPTQKEWWNPNGDWQYDGYDNEHDTPTWQGHPIRTNNLSTKIDYTRHVRDDNYTGDVQPGDQHYDYEQSLKANRNGLQLWAYNNPFFTIGYDGMPIVEQPYEHGLTVFLVKMKDSYDEYEYDSSTGKVSLKHGTMSTKYPNPDNEGDVIYGISASLYNSIASEIESVRLITNAVRIDDDQSKTNHNSGTLFNVDENDMNRFYFIAKGTPRQSVKMPTKPLFEEFSPISSLLNGWEMNFYNELMEGKIFTMQHDCSSVPEQAHAFSMHGLNPEVSTHRDVSGVTLWIPDYRMEYWEYYKGDFANYQPASREGFGRDLFKLYDNNVWRVIRYFNYNPMHMPSLALYTCKLKASTEPTQDYGEDNRNYDVTLDWSTTVSKIAGSNNAVPEDFDVYAVVDGVRQPEPLFTFVAGQDNYCDVIYNNTDLGQGEAPSSMSRTFKHVYSVPQHPDHGYWLTYQVFARVHKPDGSSEIFANVLSNTDRVWIPPYQGSGAIKLNLDVNTTSEYDRNKEVNRYVNTININNNPGNPLLISDVFMRNNNEGWNPDHVNGGGMPNGGFESNSGSPSWQWQDNNMGSEIIVYRFDTSKPAVKTEVARVYFNCLADGSRFRFAVGRRNQAESAKEGEYIYTNDDLDGVEGSNARPWRQSCDANSYNAADVFPFNNNHGYALGSSDKTGDPNTYFTKGLMVTDVFEASTASNEHPAQYGYTAEFHKYSNPNAASWGYTNMEYRSNQVTADVYKSNSESYEHTFTKDEIDNGDTMHELKVGYKAGLTVNNMLYLPEISKYHLWTTDGMVESRAERDTPNTYLVFAGNTKVDEPGQFQSVVTIPDNSREAYNLDNVFYVPVITAQLPERSNWMTGDGTTKASYTYGSDYHGTNNCTVTLKEDKTHEIAANYVPENTDINYGYATEHAVSGSNHFYGCYMTISSAMSSKDLEVYGVRVWRVRDKDKDGNAEDVLVNGWFKDEGYAINQNSLPQSCYFVIGDLDDNNGNLTVNLKDAFPGPDVETLQANQDYQPKYIVRFYARLKGTSRRGINLMADDQPQEAQGTVYYVSENHYSPVFEGDIPTAIGEVNLYGDVESVTYIDGLGRMSSRPFKGLNIVVTRLSNGTVTKTKMINK